MTNIAKRSTNLIVSDTQKVENLYKASLSREDKQIISIYINDKKQIAKFLLELSYYLGIKEPPNNTTLKLIIDFLADTYPSYTLQDIKLAFDLVLKNVISGVDIKHYQSFDIIYITSILNEYKMYRNKVVLKIKQEEQYKKDVEDGIIYDSKKDAKDINKKMADLVVGLYQNFNKQTKEELEKQPSKLLQYKHLYDILLKTKIIKGKNIPMDEYAKFSYIYDYFNYVKVKGIDLKEHLYKKFDVSS